MLTQIRDELKQAKTKATSEFPRRRAYHAYVLAHIAECRLFFGAQYPATRTALFQVCRELRQHWDWEKLP